MKLILTLIVLMAGLVGCHSMDHSEYAKGQVAAVTQAWIDGMTRHDTEQVVALYDPKAMLWGTRSQVFETTLVPFETISMS